MPAIDPTFTRPAQDSAVDRELAGHLGLKPGDPLPPLNPSELSAMEEENPELYARYQEALPELTPAQEDGAVLKVGSALSTLQVRRTENGPRARALDEALTAQERANRDGVAVAPEHLRVIDDFAKADPEIAHARGLVDAVRGVAGQRPNITGDQADAIGGATTIPGHREGFEGMGRAPDGTPAVEPSPADRAKANAAQIAGMTLVPRQYELSTRQATFTDRRTALQKDPSATPRAVRGARGRAAEPQRGDRVGQRRTEPDRGHRRAPEGGRRRGRRLLPGAASAARHRRGRGDR
ncbi:hypothetical protein [Pseudonocardia sp. HH130630-07]|uniref:hypothetical protein n=1 Tax=Pseudonocardia sp. HH130630-07 TaxID=1690815 RepID=UPI0008153DA5|nr:hypothetical protein [Pseudonocardia sp. HH130630-07]ANY05837.1 hypothetical protein AFB00_05450 [Pseudonocardia sp. HH130630-07]